MVERAGVVAQHVPIADAHASAIDDEDPAGFERFERDVHRLFAAVHTEVGAAGSERIDQRVGALLELPPA